MCIFWILANNTWYFFLPALLNNWRKDMNGNTMRVCSITWIICTVEKVMNWAVEIRLITYWFIGWVLSCGSLCKSYRYKIRRCANYFIICIYKALCGCVCVWLFVSRFLVPSLATVAPLWSHVYFTTSWPNLVSVFQMPSKSEHLLKVSWNLNISIVKHCLIKWFSNKRIKQK